MVRLTVFLALLYHSASFVITAGEVSTDEGDSSSGQGRNLHILLMTSSSQRFNSSGAETAVRLALDRVNRPDAFILPGYELRLAGVRDTKVYIVIIKVNDTILT